MYKHIKQGYWLSAFSSLFSQGLVTPSGNCSAGHYCTLKSTVMNPIGQTFGDYCPSGHYCPLGTGSPVPCPRGTYLPETGRSLDQHCLDCPGGYYCSSDGLTNVTGKNNVFK